MPKKQPSKYSWEAYKTRNPSMPKDQKPEYAPKTIWQKLAYFMEETSEANVVIGKMLRFGVDSKNPELDPITTPTNRELLLSELHDVQRALILLGDALIEEIPE